MQKLFHAPDMARESMKLSAESQPPPAHKNIPLFLTRQVVLGAHESLFSKENICFLDPFLKINE